MSRVAKSPISLPSQVSVNINGALVTVKGKLGELAYTCPEAISVVQEGEELRILDGVDNQGGQAAMAGLARALVNNMVIGVSEGFQCKLKMVGVGYRASVSGSKLTLNVGYSHPVVMEMPKDLKAECPSQTEIVISGVDKQKVFQMGANIRAVRAPEPYKGKGIRYQDENIKLKEVKKK